MNLLDLYNMLEDARAAYNRAQNRHQYPGALAHAEIQVGKAREAYELAREAALPAEYAAFCAAFDRYDSERRTDAESICTTEARAAMHVAWGAYNIATNKLIETQRQERGTNGETSRTRQTHDAA